jgi:hypothetical protein
MEINVYCDRCGAELEVGELEAEDETSVSVYVSPCECYRELEEE